MQWEADALILAARPHGETSAIVDVFSREHGRFTGLVRGGNSRRLRPVLQPGNMVMATWRARLSEHLGVISVDAGRAYAAEAMSEASLLAGLSSLCALMQITPERQAYPRLYDTAMLVLEALADAEIGHNGQTDTDVWLPILARFEMALLEETGFGLDLSCCAATGEIEDLIYVSPRSGRAVSREAGAPYADKMFALPAFLLDPAAEATTQDVRHALELLGHFLERRVYLPNEAKLPAARERLIDMVSRRSGDDKA
jgi:DNA repair protein RecO (recombination protein O)